MQAICAVMVARPCPSGADQSCWPIAPGAIDISPRRVADDLP